MQGRELARVCIILAQEEENQLSWIPITYRKAVLKAEVQPGSPSFFAETVVRALE
jgi:hypothetical protein